ncbi:hypothetical protein D3C81_1217720 [compost metagenome]
MATGVREVDRVGFRAVGTVIRAGCTQGAPVVGLAEHFVPGVVEAVAVAQMEPSRHPIHPLAVVTDAHRLSVEGSQMGYAPGRERGRMANPGAVLELVFVTPAGLRVAEHEQPLIVQGNRKACLVIQRQALEQLACTLQPGFPMQAIGTIVEDAPLVVDDITLGNQPVMFVVLVIGQRCRALLGSH